MSEQLYSLHPNLYSPIGEKMMRIRSRIEKRSAEVADAAQLLPEDDMQDVATLIYARIIAYRHRRTKTRGTLDAVIRGINETAADIKNQAYPDARKSNVVALVNGGWGDGVKQIEEETADSGARIVAIEKGVSHASAHNIGVRALEQQTGLVWMTEAGSMLASNQAFHLGAVTMHDGDIVATQGTRLSRADQSGLIESVFYNTATWHPAFWGHAGGTAREGMGFASADRTLFYLPALIEAPFDEQRFPNGGFDSAWGVQQRSKLWDGAVRMDWAASTLHSEALRSWEFIYRQQRDWADRGVQDRPYVDPGI